LRGDFVTSEQEYADSLRSGMETGAHDIASGQLQGNVFVLRDESGTAHRAVAAGSALPDAFVFTRLLLGMTVTGTVTFEVPGAQSRFQVAGLGATLELY
jgi:hypothetical protein